MIKFHITVCCFILSAVTVFSQSAQIENKYYNWASPELHKLTDFEKGQDEVTILDKTVFEFAFEGTGAFSEYKLVHKIIRVNSDNAIEMNNKVYLPISNVENILINKARVINSKGEVRELSQENILEATDEGGKYKYKYYAIEGIDVGSEIEYIYLFHKQPDYQGNMVLLQDEYFKRRMEVEVISPSNLVFETMSLNMDPAVLDSSYDDKNCYKVVLDNVEGLSEEEWSTYIPHLKQFHYKLKNDTKQGAKEIVSYSSVTEIFYSRYTRELGKKEKKALSKFLKEIGDLSAFDIETKIRKVEHYIKSNYSILSSVNSQDEPLATLYKMKYGSETDVMLLYNYVFKELGIKNNLVVTSDRNRNSFSEFFEAYHFLQAFLIYFPDLDLFIYPHDSFSRLGYIPAKFTHNKGLFIEEVDLGSIKIGDGKIKYIKPLAADKTSEQIKVKVDFDESDLTRVHCDFYRSISGYYAASIQPYLGLLDEEQSKKAKENFVKFVNDEIEIKEYKFENEGVEHYGVDPLIATYSFESNFFVENAGKKYLFKIGDLIGPQAQMYKEKERKFPVENDHNRKYLRTIEVEIPEGYSFGNLDALNIDIKFGDTKTGSGFVSSYKISGSKLIVDVNEYYEGIAYPIELFEEYRKVINAAADFNKVVLFLEKK